MTNHTAPVGDRPDDDELPLAGVRVIDFSRLLPGPWTTQMLADLGADVIKVEQPGTGDYGRFNPPNYASLGVYFNSVNRNKRSVALNLATPSGRAAADALLKTGDIVVESFRPGVTERLGIDYARVSEYNPGVIYCSVTGFGQHGTMAGLPAHDMAIQAMSGAMGAGVGPGELPGMPVFQAGDYAPAGYAISGILGAWIKRLKSGRGCHLDIAMYDAMVVWSNIALAGALARLAGFDGKPELEVWGNNPRYCTYPTRDGKAVGVCLLEHRTWRVFCDLIARPDLYDDAEHYGDRHTDHGARQTLYRDAIATLCASEDRDCLVARMMAAGVPICPVYTPDEAVRSAEVGERELIEWVSHPTEGRIPQLINPLTKAGLTAPHRHCAPALGASTTQVLRELGLGEAAIAEALAELDEGTTDADRST
ncbi:MAG: CoA transferase [Pseudomonadota bacterium]